MQVDDVKDHLPDRTVDMTYLVYRELLCRSAMEWNRCERYAIGSPPRMGWKGE